MRDFLRKTNPAEIWLGEKFQTELRLANGKLIVLRFDLQSASDNGYRFDTEKVVEQFGDSILACQETNYGEYLNVAATIADVLNTRMTILAQRVLGHSRMSLFLLDALDLSAWSTARQILCRLAESLDDLDHPRAEQIWGKWVQQVVQYVDSQDPPNASQFQIIVPW